MQKRSQLATSKMVLDGWHFGGFLGICSMLRSLSVDGLFLSNFPLTIYVEIHDAVKSG